MLAAVAEELTDGGSCKRGIIEHGCGLGCRGGNDDGIVHGAVLLECLHQVGYGGGFLANGYIDAIDGLALEEVFALIDDGVNCDGRLAGLAVADDELTLATTDGDHGVDGLETGLQRLVDGLTVDNARCLAVEGHLKFLTANGCAAINGLAKGVDDASDHLFAYLDGGDATCAAGNIALLDTLGGTEEHYAHIVFLQVHGDGHGAVFKLHEFVFGNIAQTIQTGHAVGDVKHFANFLKLHIALDALKFIEEDVGNFACFYIAWHLFA